MISQQNKVNKLAVGVGITDTMKMDIPKKEVATQRYFILKTILVEPPSNVAQACLNQQDHNKSFLAT